MRDPVLLLHGLGRTARSMRWLARRLERAGFQATPVGYPSRRHGIEMLVERFMRTKIEAHDGGPLHVVTHSLGGLLVRTYAERYGLPDGSRVVMLAPPNGGSEVADALRGWLPFRWWYGPALAELGTGPEGASARLGACDFDLGVIAGSRRLYPFFNPLFGADNDGLVAVERARVAGMKDFLIVRTAHPFIMRNRVVADQTTYFLKNGCFRHDDAG